MRGNYYTYATKMGLITLYEEEGSLRLLKFGVHEFADGFYQRNELLDEAIGQLGEYFIGKRQKFSIPFYAEGTKFQEKVWSALCCIPYGETRCYQEIAAMIQKEKACRAVGMANHKNPIAIIIPCHRVIGKHGSLVGYAGGLERKMQLLELERQ